MGQCLKYSKAQFFTVRCDNIFNTKLQYFQIPVHTEYPETYKRLINLNFISDIVKMESNIGKMMQYPLNN